MLATEGSDVMDGTGSPSQTGVGAEQVAESSLSAANTRVPLLDSQPKTPSLQRPKSKKKFLGFLYE